MKCDLCGKSAQFGHNVSHSKRHTNRSWLPNIHPASLIIDGKKTRISLCTRCLRTQNKLARSA
ncbi:MAG: 50S ribosomal protein L28 [Dehalococcoidales bacterium]|nr:50S ribosomal protein L28 [Dehalococcoidales bacterium]